MNRSTLIEFSWEVSPRPAGGRLASPMAYRCACGREWRGPVPNSLSKGTYSWSCSCGVTLAMRKNVIYAAPGNGRAPRDTALPPELDRPKAQRAASPATG